MARLIDENFEGTGYEESWIETVTSGNTLDEDSAIPGTPPSGSAAQCLKAIFTAGAINAYAKRVIGDTNIAYIRGYLYLSQEGLNNNQNISTLVLGNSSSATVAQLVITQTAGVLKAYLQYYSNGALQSTTQVLMSLATWYLIEYRYDITNMLWEWKVDGVSQEVAALSAAIRTPNNLVIGGGHGGSAQSTLYTDLVVWDNEAWPGAALSPDIIRMTGIMLKQPLLSSIQLSAPELKSIIVVKPGMTGITLN